MRRLGCCLLRSTLGTVIGEDRLLHPTLPQGAYLKVLPTVTHSIGDSRESRQGVFDANPHNPTG